MNKNVSSQIGSAHVAIIVLLVVALIGSLGFIFWQNFVNKEPVIKNDPITVTKKDSTKDNPYKDWNTHTTRNEGFSMSYPKNWTYKDTRTDQSYDSFTLTGPKGFVITCNIATIPLDGPGNDGKVVFADEIKDAGYGKPLYVIGHYNNEYSNQDKILVTSTKFEAGFSGYGGPRGFFESKIPEDAGLSTEQGSNYVFLQGEFPTFKNSEGYDVSPAHVDFDTNSDLVEARKILGSLKYN